jgi:transcriptional/translational regulatory protein YebC/TACO1
MSRRSVPVIVECLTDNRNRTGPDMRALFKNGRFGVKVLFLFHHLGIVEATHASEGLDLEAVAIEAGAQDVAPLEKIEEGSGGCFFTEPTHLDAVTSALRDGTELAGWTVALAEERPGAAEFDRGPGSATSRRRTGPRPV